MNEKTNSLIKMWLRLQQTREHKEEWTKELESKYKMLSSGFLQNEAGLDKLSFALSEAVCCSLQGPLCGQNGQVIAFLLCSFNGSKKSAR